VYVGMLEPAPIIPEFRPTCCNHIPLMDLLFVPAFTEKRRACSCSYASAMPWNTGAHRWVVGLQRQHGRMQRTAEDASHALWE
jgi:hypothetical protein